LNADRVSGRRRRKLPTARRTWSSDSFGPANHIGDDDTNVESRRAFDGGFDLVGDQGCWRNGELFGAAPYSFTQRVFEAGSPPRRRARKASPL